MEELTIEVVKIPIQSRRLSIHHKWRVEARLGEWIAYLDLTDEEVNNTDTLRNAKEAVSTKIGRKIDTKAITLDRLEYMTTDLSKKYVWDLYKQVMKARVVRFYLQEAISFGVYNYLIKEMR